MIEEIRSVIAEDERVQRVVLFGSRAKGSYREGSDIDLAVYGKGIGRRDASIWAERLEESLFPWSVDVVPISEETDTALLEHIDRVGLTLADRRSG
jgi:predicted nucleotidyltransferase